MKDSWKQGSATRKTVTSIAAQVREKTSGTKPPMCYFGEMMFSGKGSCAVGETCTTPLLSPWAATRARQQTQDSHAAPKIQKQATIDSEV
jgi:hypothetical protein